MSGILDWQGAGFDEYIRHQNISTENLIIMIGIELRTGFTSAFEMEKYRSGETNGIPLAYLHQLHQNRYNSNCGVSRKSGNRAILEGSREPDKPVSG